MLRVTGLCLLITSVALAVEPLVLRSEALPTGAVRRFGMPPQPEAQPVRVGGHVANGALRVFVAHEREIVVWAWEPVGSKPPVARLTGAGAELTRLVLSGDGTVVAGADGRGGLHVWDVATGKQHEVRAQGNAVTALALDEHGERVFFADGPTLRVYERAQQTTRELGTKTATITTLAVREALVVLADAKGNVSLRNLIGDHIADLPWQALPNKPDTGQRPDPFLRLGGGGAIKEDPKEPLQFVHEFDRGVKKLVFSPDGKYVAAAGGTMVRVWNLSNNKLVWEHNRHAWIDWGVSLAIMNYMPPPQPPRQAGGVWDIAFSRDSKYLATSGLHANVLLLHTDTGKDVRADKVPKARGTDRPHVHGRHELAFGPDGQTLTTFEGSFSLLQEEIATGKIVNRVSSHRAALTGVTVSPDGQWLATMGDDRRVRLWHLDWGECVEDVSAGAGEGQGMAFSPDGKWLCAGGAYHGFSVWQVTGTPPTLTMNGGYDTLPYRGVGFVPGEPARVAVVGPYGASRQIDLRDRKTHAFPVQPSSEVRSFSVGGKWTALAFGASATLGPQLFDLQGKAGPTLEGLEFESYSDRVQLSPEGQFLFASGTDGSFVVWDTATGRRYLSKHFGEGRVTVGAFSTDSRVLAVARLGHIHLIELATGRMRKSFRADSRGLLALHFTPTTLISGGADGVALLWDVAKELKAAAPVPKELGHGLGGHGLTTGMYAKRLPVKGHAFSTAFSPDGHTLAVGSRDVVQLFDLRTDKELVTLDADQGHVMGLAFAPNGKSLAACGEYFDGKAQPVRMWDVATQKQRWAKANTGRQPRVVVFSADSQTLYSAGKGVCRWDVATGNELLRLHVGEAVDDRGFGGPYALGVALAPDDKRLLVSGMTPEVLALDPANLRGARLLQASDGPPDGSAYVYAIAYAPDGKHIATGARDGTVRLWDGKDYTKKATWQAGDTKHRSIAQVVFAPKGDLLAAVGGPLESGMLNDIEIYDVPTRQLRMRLHGIGPHVSWSPDGRWLATAERHSQTRAKHHVLLWDMGRLLGK